MPSSRLGSKCGRMPSPKYSRHQLHSSLMSRWKSSRYSKALVWNPPGWTFSSSCLMRSVASNFIWLSMCFLISVILYPLSFFVKSRSSAFIFAGF